MLTSCLSLMTEEFQEAKNCPKPLREAVPALKAYSSAFSSIQKAINQFNKHKDQAVQLTVFRPTGPSPLKTLITQLATEEANFVFCLGADCLLLSNRSPRWRTYLPRG